MSDATSAEAPGPQPDGHVGMPAVHPRRSRLRWLGWGALAVVLFLVPIYLPGQYLIVSTWVMTGAVGAMGLTMLIGQAGQLSLAHSFFLLVGGVSYTVLSSDGTDGFVGLGLPTALSLVLAVVISALVGAAFAPVSGRLRGIYLGVASLSLVFLGWWLARVLPSIAGSTSSGRYADDLNLFGFDFGEKSPTLAILGVPIGQNERLFWLYAALTLIAYLVARGAVDGRVGRAWRAVRDNEAAATVMGVSVVRQKATAFAVSGAYAGLAGVMVVWWYDGLLKPDEAVDSGTYSTAVAIAYLAMVVIGGLGSLGGAIVGAAVVFGTPLIIPLLSQGDSTAVLSSGGTAFSPVVITYLAYGALVVLIVLFEPGGFAAIGRRIAGRFTRG
ncbi:branched-chain amino acid ABC transporter permease [Phycicoccus duodecadis]|uniref:Amino acid/amide ABC transporter membrane protein 2 (HAAT family) n=1 Tax=Phycicoccus duodecadis TaxID=173053 RepID=A0A2N3YJ90_9MICO|nr:branched-chain amino acid ABC transporter permease [Phycicoccus duodecadis]PKW26921.1 amino acid/amide ABC transporter membrane protein 2 (HAAT family) [Phycicoccus duodecadis]